MNHLGVFQQLPSGSRHRTVHVHRAQRPSSHHHQWTVRIDTELRCGRLSCGNAVMFHAMGYRCDFGTQWQSHTLGFNTLAWLQAGLRIGGANHGRPASSQFVGHSSTGILLMHRDRNAHLVRCRIYGSGRVSAEADNHLRLMTGENVTDFGRFGLPLRGKLQRRHIGPAWERNLLNGFQFETGLGNQIVFQADGSAHHCDIGVRFKLANHMRHGEQRIDMACSTTAGKNDMLLIAHSVRA